MSIEDSTGPSRSLSKPKSGPRSPQSNSLQLNSISNQADDDRPVTADTPVAQLKTKILKQKHKTKLKSKQRHEARSKSRKDNHAGHGQSDTDRTSLKKRPKTCVDVDAKDYTFPGNQIRISPEEFILADIPGRTGIEICCEDASPPSSSETDRAKSYCPEWNLWTKASAKYQKRSKQSKHKNKKIKHDLADAYALGKGEFAGNKRAIDSEGKGGNNHFLQNQSPNPPVDNSNGGKGESIIIKSHDTFAKVKIPEPKSKPESEPEPEIKVIPGEKIDNRLEKLIKKTQEIDHVSQVSASPSTLKQLANSITSIISSTQTSIRGNFLERNDNHQASSFLTGVAKIGEQLYRVGVGVATAFFSEPDTIRDDTITYNGYKIHTFGKHLCINSIILRGSKLQKLRIVVQTSDYEGFTSQATSLHVPESGETSNSNKGKDNDPSKCKCQYEQKIFVSDEKWTLIYGSYEEEGSGLVEIEAPRRLGISVKDIKSEGPCKGLIFIDVP